MAVAALYGRDGARPLRTSSTTDCVYVIGGEHGHVKIGSSGDPYQRCRDLQTGSPFRLWVEYVVPTSGPALPIELEAHALLHRYRLAGEWFAVPSEAAVAAVYAAACRTGIVIAGAAGSVPLPNWRFRFFAAGAAASPFWFALAINHPALAVAYMLIAVSVFAVRNLRSQRDPERPAKGLGRWIGAAVAGGLLPVIPALAIGMAITPAHAEEPLPSYDATKYCTNLASYMGGQEVFKTGCLSLEEATRKKVERVWSQTPTSVQSQCVKTANLANGGTYQALGGCLALMMGNMWLEGKAILSAPAK